MSMMDQFQRLDNLIIGTTVGEVRVRLRYQLALTREQIEAYQQSSDRQDQTLAAQIETIERLTEKNKKLEKALQLRDDRDRKWESDVQDTLGNPTYEPD